MLLALCLLACSPNDLTRASRLGAPSDQQPTAPPSITNLPGCATVTVQVSGRHRVTARFPAGSACPSGLVLVAGGPPAYDRSHSGRVTLRVRVVNRSSAGVRSPVRLFLGTDSALVLLAPGLALNGKKGVMPSGSDSTTSSGVAWLVDGSGVIGAGDSTTARQLVFVWADGVQQVRLALVIVASPALVGLPIGAIPPDSVMASFRATLYDSSNLSRHDSVIGGLFPRNVVIIHFKPSAGVDLRQAAIEAVGGILFGGVRTADNGDGAYLVQVPAGGSSRVLLTILDRLNAMPQVVVAWVDAQNAGPISAYPNAGQGWAKLTSTVSAEYADTARPVLPDGFVRSVQDTLTARSPDDSLVVYHRTLAYVRFLPTASGVTVRHFLARYGAIVVGGISSTSTYVLRIPDPGPGYGALLAIVKAMRREPGVDLIGGVTLRIDLGRAILPLRTPLAAVADTARPIPPDTMAWPMAGVPLLRSPDNSAVTYYRNLVSIEFGSTASGITIRSILAKYGAIIVGGYPADPSGAMGYVLQVPDPGPSMSALETLIVHLQAEPGVEFAGLNAFQSPMTARGRYPPIPLVAPDTLPAWLDDDSALTTDDYVRGLVQVIFKDGATQIERQRAVDAVDGRLIGGTGSEYGEGTYYIIVHDDSLGSGAALVAASLSKMPQVAVAVRAYRGTRPSHLRPAASGASAQPADTSRPAVPATFAYPMDSLYLVQNPADTRWIYLRRFAIVGFKKSATGIEVRQFFARCHAIVVGGLKTLGDYVVQLPDPGASWSAYSAFVDSLNADPAVRYVTPISWRGARPKVNNQWRSGAISADTGRPFVPDSLPNLGDSAHVVSDSSDGPWVYLRRYLTIRFDDSTSGLAVRQVLSDWSATVVGGIPYLNEYIVEVPDLGPNFPAYANRIHSIERARGVQFVVPMLARDDKPMLHPPRRANGP